MKKRLISLALVLVLALSLLPVAALAADYDDFADLKKDVWYTPYINFVLEKGYFIGMSDTEFAPNYQMTRAMFVTVLGRLAGINPDDYTEMSVADAREAAKGTKIKLDGVEYIIVRQSDILAIVE